LQRVRCFDDIENDKAQLELLQIVEGKKVTHVRYKVADA
jgi:hypothetical protein